MINFYDQVPTIYTSASRDFQYLSWLINIVLNSVKHNVDDLYDLPNTKSDPRLTELLAMTLGFKVKRSYDQKQLAVLVSIIPSILKYKGTIKAVIMAARALLNTSGTLGEFNENQHCKIVDGNILEVTLPKGLVDVTLFMDLLPYILPAGLTYRIVRKSQESIGLKTTVPYHDTIRAEWHTDLNWDKNNQKPVGLANMFETGERMPDFAFIKDKNISEVVSNNNKTDFIPTSGILNSNLIPVLEGPIVDPKSKEHTKSEET